MIKRCQSAKKINELINHPDILAEGPEFDVTPFVNKVNYFMVAPGCLFGFYDQGNGTFDLHIGALKKHRGAAVMKSFKQAVDYIFSNTQCIRISGFIPMKNLAARKFGRLVGFKANGVSLKTFVNGRDYMCENFILDREFV